MPFYITTTFLNFFANPSATSIPANMPPKPFKPPRPNTTTKKTPKPKSTTARKPSTTSKPRPSGSTSFSRPSLPDSVRSSHSDSEADPFASTAEDEAYGSAEDEDNEIQDVEMEVEDEKRETIPQELLTRLLHEFFKEEGTRISKDANTAVGRYMETFVREALARAAFMRAEMDGGDGFLEVSCCYNKWRRENWRRLIHVV
jgi:hypothetical protein